MAGNFCAQNFICSLAFTKEISLRIDFENLRHPKRVWTYDFKGAVERISFRNNVLYLNM